MIHALAARLGMNDEAYRAMLSGAYGVESSTALTPEQRQQLINELRERLAPAAAKAEPAEKRRARFEELGDRPDFATPAQLRMLEAAFVRNSRAGTLAQKREAFVVWLKNHWRLHAVSWIARDQVRKILTAIESIDPNATPRTEKTSKGKRPHGKD